MSKHISRKSRWSRCGPNEHRSAVGRVYYRAGQWHAAVTYQVRQPEGESPVIPQSWELGKFKRPRNAMMAVEDKARDLQGKFGEEVVFLSGSQVLG
jgi:hypothetical protein